jgi:hypothetical protein
MRHDVAVKIFVGFIVGVVAGLIFKALNWQGFIEASSVLGDLFLRALRMIVIPLIFSSLALSVAQLGDIARLSRLGWWTVVYYLVTNAIAVTIGLTLVNLLQPGFGFSLAEGKPPELPPLQLKTLILNIVPANPIEALAKGEMLALIFLALLTGCSFADSEGNWRTCPATFAFGFGVDDDCRSLAACRCALRCFRLGCSALGRVWFVRFLAFGEICLDSHNGADNSRLVGASASGSAFRSSFAFLLPSPFCASAFDCLFNQFKFGDFACHP